MNSKFFNISPYLCFRNLRDTTPPKILMNLCIAVIAFSLVFLIGAEKRDFMSKIDCSVTAAFIHYFILTIFTWSTIEAFHSGRGLVLPMKVEISNFLIKSLIFGWGKWRCSYLSVFILLILFCFLFYFDFDLLGTWHGLRNLQIFLKNLYLTCQDQVTLCKSLWLMYRLWEKPHYCISIIPENIYLFKVNNRNTKNFFEICSNLTLKTTERCQWCRSGVFIVNFEHVLKLFLFFSIIDFEHVFIWWEGRLLPFPKLITDILYLIALTNPYHNTFRIAYHISDDWCRSMGQLLWRYQKVILESFFAA